MQNTHSAPIFLPTLLMVMLMAGNGFAQFASPSVTAPPLPPEQTPPQESATAQKEPASALNFYNALEARSSSMDKSSIAEDSNGGELRDEESSSKNSSGISGKEEPLIAQARVYGRMHGRPMPRRARYYPGYVPPPGFSPFGALIGFGIGASAGAAGHADGTTKGRVGLSLACGGFGALIGGAVGSGVSHFNQMAQRSRQRRRHPWKLDDSTEHEQEASTHQDSRPKPELVSALR
jgi:hypothetical protein